MFKKLKAKWKVNNLQLTLVLITFALGGSLCGFLGKKVMAFMDLPVSGWFIPIYILVVTLLWPLCVIAISILCGQYTFFSNYLGKMGRRFGFIKKETATKHNKTRIAIFASGSGSNALKLIEYFTGHPTLEIGLMVCNKAGAGALTHAKNHQIPVLIIEKESFINGHHYLPQLLENNIGFIVLAGFLWKIPSALISAFPNKIINLHPALLPKYGGKGMYGQFVHEAVIKNGETESGITIHFVDEHYDHGAIIFQALCPVSAYDTPTTLAMRIQTLEHTHLPKVVEQVASGT